MAIGEDQLAKYDKHKLTKWMHREMVFVKSDRTSASAIVCAKDKMGKRDVAYASIGHVKNVQKNEQKELATDY